MRFVVIFLIFCLLLCGCLEPPKATVKQGEGPEVEIEASELTEFEGDLEGKDIIVLEDESIPIVPAEDVPLYDFDFDYADVDPEWDPNYGSDFPEPVFIDTGEVPFRGEDGECLHPDCFFLEAKKDGDPDKCKYAGDYVGQCYREVAVKNNDVSLCDMADSDMRCFSDIAVAYEKPELCADAFPKEDLCFTDLAVKYNKPEYCDRVIVEWEKIVCLERVRTNRPSYK